MDDNRNFVLNTYRSVERKRRATLATGRWASLDRLDFNEINVSEDEEARTVQFSIESFIRMRSLVWDLIGLAVKCWVRLKELVEKKNRTESPSYGVAQGTSVKNLFIPVSKSLDIWDFFIYSTFKKNGSK